MKRWVWHAVGLGVLCLAGVVAHGSALVAPTPLADESAYVCAAEALARGQSPYADCPRYLYPPALARAGALLVELGGRVALLATLRGLVWLGAIAAVWLSLALTRWCWRVRTLLGAMLMLAAPPVTQALELGNLSSAVAGLSIAALFVLERGAKLAAFFLTFAIFLKPLPAALPFVLLAQGLARLRLEPGRFPRPVLVGGSTVLACGALFAFSGGLGETHMFPDHAQNSISLVRLLHVLGFTAPPALLFAAVLVGGGVLAFRRAGEPRFVAGLALVSCLLSARLVWNHSWLMVLPILAAAADRALARYRAAPADPEERSRGLRDVLLVGLGGCALATSDELGSAFLERPLVNALLVALLLVTPSLLLAYACLPLYSSTPNPSEPRGVRRGAA